MRNLNYKSKAHPIHDDIKPIVSALRHGNKRIAEMRFKKLCNNLNLARWETLVVADLVHKAVKIK